MTQDIPVKRYAELIKERTVERFLQRLFLRDISIRCLAIIAPYISSLSESRYSLSELRKKIERQQIPTYVVTRKPSLPYQEESVKILLGSPWVELRYNESIHAKVYVAASIQEGESFALFGSGNLTAKSIESNIEIGMMLYSQGAGRDILRDLEYWASMRVRTLKESQLIQPIRAKRR